MRRHRLCKSVVRTCLPGAGTSAKPAAWSAPDSAGPRMHPALSERVSSELRRVASTCPRRHTWRCRSRPAAALGPAASPRGVPLGAGRGSAGADWAPPCSPFWLGPGALGVGAAVSGRLCQPGGPRTEREARALGGRMTGASGSDGRRDIPAWGALTAPQRLFRAPPAVRRAPCVRCLSGSRAALCRVPSTPRCGSSVRVPRAGPRGRPCCDSSPQSRLPAEASRLPFHELVGAHFRRVVSVSLAGCRSGVDFCLPFVQRLKWGLFSPHVDAPLFQLHPSTGLSTPHCLGPRHAQQPLRCARLLRAPPPSSSVPMTHCLHSHTFVAILEKRC